MPHILYIYMPTANFCLATEAVFLAVRRWRVSQRMIWYLVSKVSMNQGVRERNTQGREILSYKTGTQHIPVVNSWWNLSWLACLFLYSSWDWNVRVKKHPDAESALGPEARLSTCPKVTLLRKMLLHLAKFVQFLFEPVRFGSHIALHTPQAGVWTLNDIGWSDFASLHVFHGQEWQAAFLHAKIEEKTLLASTTLVARRPPSRDHALVSWVW